MVALPAQHGTVNTRIHRPQQRRKGGGATVIVLEPSFHSEPGGNMGVTNLYIAMTTDTIQRQFGERTKSKH